uniref:PDZ domain-containing protein n=1 Tax=Hippocampus comes TaxID=109280 RepID=A0A3Q2XV33_HIPCM
MKVTVTFGDTAVVVPCKPEWTVRDLIDQSTRRYRRIFDQHGSAIKTLHLEYTDGGILDMDDLLTDLVDDRDKVSRGRALSCSQVSKGKPFFLFVTVQFIGSALTRTVNLLGDRGPLGIEVMPYCSSLSGRMLGLHIKNIEDTSRTKIENIFQEDECIVQINGISLQDKSFADSQEVFRQALSSPSMHLEVVPVANKPRYEKGLIGHLFTGDSKDLKAKSPVVARDKIDLQPVAIQHPKPKESLRHHTTGAKTPEPTLLNPTATPVNPLSADSQYGNSQSEIISPTPQVPPKGSYSPPRSRRQSPPASKSSSVPGPASLTNKKSGKRIKIDLTKGAEGLGFTVVTRDSTSSGPGPILVKNILQRGAAIKDGRLQPGDRILEVNGMDMTGRSQEELVAMLRSTKQGESVCVTVARQEDVFLPRELKGEDAGNLVLEDGREQLMYEVPLNETGSAGLGVSLKGNKSRETGEDLGIFIKSIIHGGAAYKDGRLRVNDQLIAVNGEALLGLSNHAAMETLRRSMSSEGNARGTIQLVVLRASRVEVTVLFLNAPSLSIYNPLFLTNPTSFQKVNLRLQRQLCLSPFPPPPLTLSSLQVSQCFWGFFLPNFDPLEAFGSTRNPHLTTCSTLHSPEPAAGGALGPTLGLWKSSSLESLQSAMSEVQQNDIKAQVPFHRPRPHMVRGRGCNQSFRIAIDKSYEGPSEDDDDPSELSSGHETPVSSSSRQDLDVEDLKMQKKVSGRKQAKKSKGKKRSEDATDDMEKKSRKKGFALLRFGKKKDDKSKDAAKVAKNKLEAWSEEESYDSRYAEIDVGQLTPGPRSLPGVADDDNDPNYAQVSNFLQPSSLPLMGRTPSPATPVNVETKQPHGSADELEGLYAKVNKSRQQPAQRDEWSQGMRREYPRAAAGYEELDTARRRVLENDPQRVSLTAFSSVPFRRDPYDYPSHSRSAHREPVHYQDRYRDKSLSVHQPASSNQRHYTSSPHAGHQYRAVTGQDALPSPATGRKERHYYEAVGNGGDGYRQGSPGRYASPDRYGYPEDRQPDPRRKNPMIGAV